MLKTIFLFLVISLAYAADTNGLIHADLIPTHIKTDNVTIDIVEFKTLNEWGRTHKHVTLIKMQFISKTYDKVWVRLDYIEPKQKEEPIEVEKTDKK